MDWHVKLMYTSYFIYTDEKHVAFPLTFQRCWGIPEKVAKEVFQKCNAGKGTYDAWAFANEDDAIAALTMLKLLRC